MGQYVPTLDEPDLQQLIDRLVRKFRLREIAIATKNAEFRAIAFSQTRRPGVAATIWRTYGAITKSPLSALKALEEKLEGPSDPIAAGAS